MTNPIAIPRETLVTVTNGGSGARRTIYLTFETFVARFAIPDAEAAMIADELLAHGVHEGNNADGLAWTVRRAA